MMKTWKITFHAPEKENRRVVIHHELEAQSIQAATLKALEMLKAFDMENLLTIAAIVEAEAMPDIFIRFVTESEESDSDMKETEIIVHNLAFDLALQTIKH